MPTEQEQQDEPEVLALSSEANSIEELEERLELTTGILDALCVANACGLNGCGGNLNW